MQWNGARPNPDRPAPLRSLMELLQQKVEPYVTQYGENQLPGAGQLLNSIMRTGTEMVPGVGDLLGAEDLQTAAQNNDWAGIGLGALAAIPGIPAIGRGVRGEARAARGVANTVADAVPTNQPMTEAEAALARYRAANPNDTGAQVLSPGDQGYPTNAQWDEASQAYVAPRADALPAYDRVWYRGTSGSDQRITGGIGEGLLFAAPDEKIARLYGDTIEQIGVPPTARVLLEGSPEFAAVTGRRRGPLLRTMRSGENIKTAADEAVERARAAGYDAVEFNSMPDMGVAIINPDIFARDIGRAPVEPDYPIRAYHGSPHSFDRFSLDKIGTGEGAQAYGHGLYFAENEGVARSYRDQLSNWTADGKGLGKKLSMDLGAFGGDLDALMANRMEQLANWTSQDPNHFITRDLQRDVAELEALKAKTLGSSGSMYEVGINADPNTFLDWDRPLSEQPESVMSALRNTLGGSGVDLPNGVVQLENGRWATAVDGVPIGRPQGWPNQSTAEQALKYAQEDGQYLYGTAGSILQRQRNQPEISAALAAQGIPGIRYLDASSRYNPAALPDNPISNEARQWLDIAQGDSAEALRQFNASNPIERFAGPERDEVRKVIEAAARRPTSNYVVFNDELVKILRKYGISGLSTTVGASALAEELDRRGQTQEF